MNRKKLSCVIFLLALVARLLRELLYNDNLDARGLLPGGSFLEIALWLLTAAALVMCYLAEPLRAKGKVPCVAELLFAWGLLFSAEDLTAGYASLLTLVKLASVLATLVLAADGVLKWRGKTLPGAWIVVCAAMVLRLVAAYQTWSREPQMLNFLPPLFASLSLTAFAYRQAAERAGMPSSPWTGRLALAAGYLGVLAGRNIHQGQSVLLFYTMIGCACFVLSFREEEKTC